MTAFLCCLAGFVLGSLPFSVWLVRWFRHADVRRVGDGNPGAVNAWSAGGWRIGVSALLLDVAKGAAAPAAARLALGVEGWALVPVALAPLVGHAFSPWLGFRGGKGIASTFGVWTALTAWLVPTTLGVALLAFLAVQSASAWTVLFAAVVAFAVLAAVRPDAPLLAALAANIALLAWTHRRELRSPPRFHAPGRKKKG
mgnify:CR=1 FL=1